MSEYQYYEFQAVDRPLTRREMEELRARSSRASITPSRFVNHYEWGDFKGDPQKWMEKYFDAHLYLANWGSRHLALRFPRAALPIETAKAYCRGDSASVSAKGDHVILNFSSQDEEGDWDSDGRDEMASLLPVRAEIAAGDYRALYLGWLLAVQADEIAEGDREPSCPGGLRDLTGPQEAFVRFLRVDRDILAVASERSPEAEFAQ